MAFQEVLKRMNPEYVIPAEMIARYTAELPD